MAYSMSIWRRIPLPMAALSLALFSLGNLWGTAIPFLRNGLGGIAGVILIAYTIRILADLPKFAKEMAQPPMASIFATYPMSFVLFSTYLKQWVPVLAEPIWWTGLLMHICLILWFTIKHAFPFQWRKTMPSWFVLYVGIATAAVTAPAMNQKTVGTTVIYFAIAAWVILLPTIGYRYLKGDSLPAPLMPTWAIVAAPTSLCLAGLLASNPQAPTLLVYILQVVALICYFLGLPALKGLGNLKFLPAISAYTFPMVISAIAAKSSLAWFTSQGVEHFAFAWVSRFSLWVATFATIVVLTRYVVFLLTPTIPNQIERG